MAEPSVFDLKNATLKILDGTTPTPFSLTVKFDEGNFTFTHRRNIEYKLDRGRLATGAVREGDEVPMDVSFQGRFNALISSSGDPKTVYESLTKTGAASARAVGIA